MVDAGAVIGDGRVLHFAKPEEEAQRALNGDIVVDLSHLALLTAAGGDAERFLQGQLTNDIRKVSDKRSQLSAWCSPKGRVIASFLVIFKDGVYYLQLPAELSKSTLKRLQMYVLRSDVRLADASNNLVRIGVSGVTVVRTLSESFGILPNENGGVIKAKDLTVVKLLGNLPRYEILGTLEPVKHLWSELSRVALPAGAGAWAFLDILAGLPTVGEAIADEFVPQMLNLDALDAVSFNKGCYTGQEIVARTQHLGILKRRMYLGHLDTAEAPCPGDSLKILKARESQTIGKVVNAEQHPTGGVQLLAVIQIEATRGGGIHIAGQDERELRIEPLPYPLEDA